MQPGTVDPARVADLVAVIVHRLDAVTNREPWTRLSREERINHLPPLLGALLTSALVAGDQRGAGAELVENATIHGQHRRQQRFDEEILLDEYYLLRDHAYRVLRAHHTPDEIIEITLRLDPAITIASVASLRGYHGIAADVRNPFGGAP